MEEHNARLGLVARLRQGPPSERSDGVLLIRGRLIFIAVVLLAILTVSSTILTRELMRDLQSLADEAQLVQVVQSANEASKHFGDLKYWITDDARTLLAASQRQADAAKAQLEIESEGGGAR